MAKLRKGCSYRSIENPYTRKSKFRKKAFIRATPHCKVTHFVMGDPKKNFDTTINLVSKTDLQIRHNALESARLTSNRLLEKSLSKAGFHLTIVTYPHHVLRENPLASGAGADRMSTGMKASFGKTIGIAAQVRKGQTVFKLRLDKANIELGRLAMKRASMKLPNSYSVRIASAA